jgi:hypothetical protein
MDLTDILTDDDKSIRENAAIRVLTALVGLLVASNPDGKEMVDIAEKCILEANKKEEEEYLKGLKEAGMSKIFADDAKETYLKSNQVVKNIIASIRAIK